MNDKDDGRFWSCPLSLILQVLERTARDENRPEFHARERKEGEREIRLVGYLILRPCKI